MGAQRLPIIGTGITKGDPAIATRLKREIEGEVLFDSFSRGRYSTDASHYQIERLASSSQRLEQDVRTAMEIAAEEGIPLTKRRRHITVRSDRRRSVGRRCQQAS